MDRFRSVVSEKKGMLGFDREAPYEVEELDEVFARPGGEELLARVYRPKGELSTLLAGLIDVHGGAWNRFDRRIGANYARGLAACGLVVGSVDFRQGPDHQHPTASADVAAGVRYLRANAARLGVNPGQIGLVGSSSGRHLALLAAIRAGAPEHAGTPIVLPDDSTDSTPGDESVGFVLALFPVSDPLARFRYALTREHEPPQPAPGFDAPGLIAAHRA